MKMNKLSISIFFTLRCLVKLRDMNDLVDLRLFYDWYFNELSSMSKSPVWSCVYWKKIRSKILQANFSCVLCGSTDKLVINHTIRYLHRFDTIFQFHSRLKFLSWQKFRKFYKLYGPPSLFDIFSFYKSYLIYFFSNRLDYFTLVNIQVYCKKCAYSYDYLYTLGFNNKNFVSFSDDIFIQFLSIYFNEVQNKHTPEERP